MKITTTKLNQIIKEEVSNVNKPDIYEKIKQLAEVGEKIKQQIDNSFSHLTAFLSLGTKTRSDFEFLRATKEIGRIQKLTSDYQVIITKAHEMAEQDSKQEQQNLQQQENPRLQSKEVVQKQQPIVKKDNLQESKGITYGIILDDSGKIKNVEHIAKDEQELKIYLKKNYPLYEVKKIIVLKESFNAIGEAQKLLQKLKDNAKKNPKSFGENYGQKEIRQFEDKLSKENVSYSEKAKALDIVERISEFSPFDENSDMIMNRQQSELEEISKIPSEAEQIKQLKLEVAKKELKRLIKQKELAKHPTLIRSIDQLIAKHKNTIKELEEKQIKK